MKKFLIFLVVSFALSFYGFGQATNNSCAAASPISIPSSGSACVTGSTAGGQTVNWTSLNCGPATWPNSVWYAFVSTGSTNTVIVSPTGSPAAQQLGVSIFTGGCSNFQNTPGSCAVSATNGGSDTVSYAAPIGTLFYVEVSSFAAAGNFEICVKSATPPPAPGSTCATASHLCSLADFSLASVPLGGTSFTPDCFQGTPNSGQWYQFTVGVSGNLVWECAPTTPCTVHSTPLHPYGNGVELDWAMYDITNGCPTNPNQGGEVACNFNFEGANSYPIGMSDTSTTVCPIHAFPGTQWGEFCHSQIITAGQTYAIFINNFTDTLPTGWNFTFQGSTFQMAPIDTFTVSPDTICGNSGTVTLTNGSLASVWQKWSFGDGTTSAAVNPGTHAYSSPGTYFVSLEDSSQTGCVAVASKSVLISAFPVLTLHNDTICPGGTGMLVAGSSVNGSTYLWSNGATTDTISISPTSTTTYKVTVSNNTGCSAVDSAVVITQPFSVSVNPATRNICAGQSVTLTCSYFTTDPQAYHWSNGNSTQGTIVTPQATTTYTVTVTNPYGCTATASAVVNVDNVNLTINPTTASLCAGQSLTLTASAANDSLYSWSNGPLTDTNTVSPVTTTQYKVVATDKSNCSATDSVTVTIGVTPTAVFTVTSAVCVGQNDSITYTGTSSPAAVYTWSFGGGNVVSGTNKGPYQVNWNTPGQAVISLSVTDNGCVAVPQSDTIVIDSLPVSDAGSDTTYCSGITVVIGTASTPGYTYSWSPSTSLSSATVSNPTVSLTNTSANVWKQKYIVTTSNTGCASTDSVTLTIDPIPVPQFTQPAPQCLPNNSFSFTASGSFLPTATFEWSFGANATPPASTLQSQTVTYSAVETTAVSLVITQMGCVSNPFTDSVTINPLPVASFNPDNTLGCQNLNVCFTNSSTNVGVATYLWNFGDGQTSTQQAPCHIYTVPGIYSVYLDVTANNCSDDTTLSGIIKIIAGPVARFTPSSTIIQQPQSEIYFTNRSLNSSVYNWNFGGIGTSSDVSPSFNFTQYGRYNIILVAEDSIGCLDTTEIPITVLPPQNFFIPNVFTPNNDGKNDEFYIETQEGVTVTEFTVFDRWGEKVHDGQYPWDGNFKGKPCPAGVYVYVFKLQLASNADGVKRTGSVTLFR